MLLNKKKGFSMIFAKKTEAAGLSTLDLRCELEEYPANVVKASGHQPCAGGPTSCALIFSITRIAFNI